MDARRFKAITSRQLSRSTARYLDEVERYGACWLVVRRGLPVAKIEPATEMLASSGLSIERADRDVSPTPEVDLDAYDLTEEQEQLLVSCAPRFVLEQARMDSGLPIGRLGLVVCQLEIKGLLARKFGGYELLPEGREVVAALRRRRSAS